MRYSRLFGKTRKEVPRDEESVNANLLIRGGFIDKLMAGSFTLLPLGKKVISKIEKIVREEMNATGAQEILMPLLHPKEIWNETGRWESAKEVMYQFKKNNKDYALSFTHEEIVLDVVRKHAFSYKDYPIKIYHFSTKFRDEMRPKSGILRGREFIMKDLYSLHVSKEDYNDYYWKVANAYLKIFNRMKLNAKIVEAGGGVFTEEHTHEFQVLSDTGEDIIYYCDACDFAQNKEILTTKEGDPCPKCKKGRINKGKSIEVGNIFPLGTSYAKKMGIYFIDKDGNKINPWLASYGIGLTRMLGTLVEEFHDEKGIIWPETVAPYNVHLVPINKNADSVYENLKKEGIDVLYDDREVSPGEKFKDADLIGIPVRLVVSEKAGEKVEFKRRKEEKIELLSVDEIINQLKNKSV